ncbi:UDP-N-acetylmuramate--L-alanine ligase [Roseiarcus fermentans]|uniref:UDP-N-acetylmuramate--L-alanine ligase n=1 Tax=Roseiarcus fermentans TaxID=1473586 RepID=A0A366F631_9HYPH|nr:Mur ligase family protein [Roseiarcus fermentans]RBP09165.1 UDP-N-acetylmuramate--L-alanine ligase [Roseiarcus fermentans]
MTAFPFRKAHFIGLAGVGMSATAILLRDSGVAVTGSDEAVYPPISHVLAREHLACRTPYAPQNIPDDADLIVIGKNARLTPDQNAEVAEAFRRAAAPGGAKILSFAEALALLSRGRDNIVAAGSFGKTTSVAMMAHCLASAGLDPSWMIGAVPLSPARAANAGQGRFFLLEGDEYPSSNTDNRSKFLHYRPAHLLLAPLAHDHVNVFPTIESYLAPFHRLFDLVPRDGLIVAATSGELSERFLADVKRDVVTFGLTRGDWRAVDIDYGETSQFTLTERGRAIARVTTSQLGAHNIENMVGIGAFVLTLGLVGVEQYAAAMASFRGVVRRLDRKSDLTSVQMFEGFGSSYDKAKSAIAAMKTHFARRRLLVVFEPHTFSWRNRNTLAWYDDVFKGCDRVFIYEPANQGAATHEQASLNEIMARVYAAGVDATPIHSCAEGLKRIGAELRADDAVLFLTSGDIGGLIERLPALAETLHPLRGAV